MTFLLKQLTKLAVVALALIMFPAFVLYKTGELHSLAGIVALQKQGKYLFGTAYVRPYPYFKLKATLVRKPTVLALGTSRIEQVRQEQFKPGISFYNASKGILSTRELLYFLRQIPRQTQPKVIILSLDQTFFNDAWRKAPESGQQAPELLYKSDDPFTFLLENTKRIYLDVLRAKKFPMTGVLNHSPAQLGLFAIFHHDGYRSDGSYYAGYLVESDELTNHALLDLAYQNTLDQINNGTGNFIYGSKLSEAAVKELDDFLEEAQKRQISVIGFLPPFPPPIYAAIKKRQNDFAYIFQIMNRIQPLFRKRSFILADYSDAAKLGSSNYEAIDGYHSSEKTYQRLFIDLAKCAPALQPYVDIPKLEIELKNATSEVDVYPE